MTIEKYEVRNRWTGALQFTAEIAVTPDTPPSVKLGLAVQWGVKNGANLGGADLRSANLRGANLSGADLGGADLGGADLRDAYLRIADLRDANLRRADLRSANLSSAILRSANLSGADLGGADLGGAYLRDANLSSANLSSAILRSANLSGANLGGADLRSANLRGANLSGAYLRDAKGAELAIARTRILPEGALIGWKKCRQGALVKLRIPEDAKRSHAFGRKCRAEFAEVLEVIGAEVGISQHDGKTEYRAGERVTCDVWSDDWQEECAGGIHFYITRDEAEAY